MTLLFVSPPFAGHLDRMIPLAIAARDAGHRCHFVTGHARLADLWAQGFIAEAPESLPVGALEAIAEGHGRIHGRPWRALAQLRENLTMLPSLTDDLVAIIRATSARAVIADSIALMAGPATTQTGVPWITTIATPLALEGRTGTPGYMGGWMSPSGPMGRVRDTIARRAQRLCKRTAFALMARRVRHLMPALYRADGSEAIYSPQAILGFGMTELEFERDWPTPFEMIGPIHGPAAAGAPLPLPAGPRVLATLGTHLPWARDVWFAGVTALARARPDVHFTLTHGRRGGPIEWPLPNLMAVSYADYATEVPRHDVVIHHGGSGIAYASIEAGKPSLVVPQDFDQFDYAARIAYHGLGLRARSLTGAAPLLDGLLQDDWPATHSFAKAAARYDPQCAFLRTLERLL